MRQIRVKKAFSLMRRSNCSAPFPPGGAPVSSSLYFSLALPYISTVITLFSSTPPLFITHIFRLTPGLPQGGMGAEQFDRRII